MQSLWTRFLIACVEPIIPLSYGRPGLALRRKLFVEDADQTNLAGKVCLVTGANSGIGYATAKILASQGAEVWLLCRNPKRADAALQQLQEETGSDSLHVGIIDLSLRSSIESFVRDVAPPRVDVLIHNAGVMPGERVDTEEGVELTLATNLLGPLLLTHLLLPALQSAGQSRVIHVSSGGMYTQRLNLERLWAPPAPFDGVVQYAQTKRALVIMAELLARAPLTYGISFQSMHPGWADTPAVRSSLPRFWKLTRSILRTPAGGADTAAWLASTPQVAGDNGRFWFDRKARSPYLLPGTREEESARQELWARALPWMPGQPTP